MDWCTVDTPVGRLRLEADEAALLAARFVCDAPARPADTALLRQAAQELAAYFDGRLRAFHLPLAPQGTPFQRCVWQALTEIPFGQTATYGDVAAAVGRPRACRAVGQANNRNPIAIVVPCHRVIGASGALTGYAGGLWIKEYLLKLEGAL